MDLPRSLIKDFAEVTDNPSNDSEKTKYVRGTIKVSGDSKYVQIDGSSTLTPISEVVDVQEDDRVLVTIENHKATILGNFTFPPSARKEQEAVDKAEDAQNTANDAKDTADNATDIANSANENVQGAIDKANEASDLANQAKEEAAGAIDAANSASQNATAAKESAAQAAADAATAREEAAASQEATAAAQEEINKINGEITTVKGDINTALDDLADQAAEIEATKQTMELNYAKKTDVSSVEASLKTEISTKVGELQTTVEQNYAAKTDVVDLEGRLQTQITQNEQTISSTATKVEKLESDTAEAVENVNTALDKANAAQTAAGNAQTAADAAQAAADQAKADAATATSKANAAQSTADAAQAAVDAADAELAAAKTDLEEAKQNLTNVTNRVGATEEDIAAAQAAVDAAEKNVNKALADVAEAQAAADAAQTAANQAQTDAEEAQTAASNAQLKADNAQAVADKAQEDALKAQEDVAALTKRVTTAETEISQNAEQIALLATKTDEIGDLLINDYYNKVQTDAAIKLSADEITAEVSRVEETLRDDYYTKEQADSAIKVSADNITSTVSKTYSTKTETIKNMVDEFYLSDSPATLTGGSWSSEQPVWTQGKYIWRRTLVTHGDNTKSYTPSENGVCISGNDGADGDSGSGLVLAIFSSNGSFFKNEDISTTLTAHVYKDGTEITGSDLTALGTIRWYKGRITSPVATGTTLEVSSDADSEDYTAQLEASGESSGKVLARDKITLIHVDEHLDDIQNAQNTADEAAGNAAENEERISNTESSITQLADSITTLITDENGNSMMEQTSDGWTFNISAITQTIEDTRQVVEDMSGTVGGLDQTVSNLDSLINDLTKKTAYIIMSTDDEGNPCIELGKEGNDFKVRITNTSVDFMEGSAKIAYVSNKKLFIETAVIKNELKIGENEGFIWKTRGNGNMGLRWVEGG